MKRTINKKIIQYCRNQEQLFDTGRPTERGGWDDSGQLLDGLYKALGITLQRLNLMQAVMDVKEIKICILCVYMRENSKTNNIKTNLFSARYMKCCPLLLFSKLKTILLYFLRITTVTFLSDRPNFLFSVTSISSFPANLCWNFRKVKLTLQVSHGVAR